MNRPLAAGTGTRPLRILIAAENASMRFGGEALLPVRYLRLLRARGLDVHLVVHERCRAELEELFADDRDRLHFVADQSLQKLFFRLGRALPRRLDEATFGLFNQMLTQHAQRTVLRQLIQQHKGAGIVHQPIPVSPRTPSLLAGLGAALVVGPLNGGMEYPPAFRTQESLLTRVVVSLARSLTDLANALFPGKRNAALVLVANARTRAALPARLRGRVIEVVENGVELAAWTLPADVAADAPAEQTPTFLFIGRLVDWKALDIALEALAQVPHARLDVVGDGPLLETWRALAVAQGVAERVHFLGWKTAPECAALLRQSHALLLPSLFEAGGAVVLEAMAMARPVIATAWGGPADYLNADCGILVQPSSRAELIAGFASAMRLLAGSPALRERMGRAGRERLLEEFTWERKIDTLLALYQTIL